MALTRRRREEAVQPDDHRKERGASSPLHIPTHLSVISLVSSCFVLITGGTMYLYSLFGPPFGTTFGYTQSQITFIGSCGNAGNFITGPPMGWLADRPGNTWSLLLGGGLAIFTGYLMVGITYAGYVPYHDYLLLSLYFTIIGMGSHTLYAAAQATNLRNWSSRWKGLAIGLPAAFFGLGAFVFDGIAYTVFKGSDGSIHFLGFFLFLACSALVINGMAIWFLKDYSISTGFEPVEPSQASSPNDSDMLEMNMYISGKSSFVPVDIDVDSCSSASQDSLSDDLTLIRGSEDGSDMDRDQDTYPPFFTSLPSYLIGLAMMMVIGSGLMYITNVSAIITALSTGTDDAAAVQQSQGLHVALISISSFLGRMSIGCLLDMFHACLGVPRAAWSLLSASIMLCAQVGMTFMAGKQSLPVFTCMIGYAYGMMWASSPVILSELYGNARFAFYWGCLILLPSVSGFLVNTAFGAVYDAHSSGGVGPSIRASLVYTVPLETDFKGDELRNTTTFLPLGHSRMVGDVVGQGNQPRCSQGHACFQLSFVLTSVMCLLACMAMGWLIFTRSKAK